MRPTKTPQHVLAAQRLATERARQARVHTLNSLTRLQWIAEHKFCDGRKWAFDFACQSIATAIEIEGGVFARGRHSRGVGMVADMQKYNTAQLFGWIVLRYTPEQFAAGEWLHDVEVAKRRIEKKDGR